MNTKKIVLITGATSGIGAACAHVFAREGYSMILTGRRKEILEALAHDLQEQFKSDIITLSFDIQNSEQVSLHLENLPDIWKQPDVLINNAGLSLGLDPIHEGNISDWETMIDTNIKGLLYITSTVSKWMVKEKKGHIINIGSIAAKEVYTGGNVYCATKYAVDALNMGMRLDLLPYGIKVTAIHPGFTTTEFSNVRFKGNIERAAAVYDGFLPLMAEDIAETVWFAASRPAHVNINDLLVMPTAQASVYQINRTDKSTE